MKKILLGLLLATGLFTTALQAAGIHPVTREIGSGTRAAFVEIFGIQKVIRGKKIDGISTSVEVTNSTGVMMLNVAGSKDSIGYISLGSLDSTIKALSVDGVSPSVDAVKDGSYKVARPFNVVVKTSSPLSEDFLAYAIAATDIIQKAGYIPTESSGMPASKKPAGKLVIAGSSSVTPLMEKLVEGYKKVNPKAKIEIQQSDSTTGVNSVVEGIADIGMVSREVKQAELDKGLTSSVLAIDGLVVIVNKENPLSNISSQSVKQIFMGEIKDWAKVK